MNARELIEFVKKSNKMGPMAAMADPEMMSKNNEMLDYFNAKTHEAADRVMERMSENDIVHLFKMIEGMVTAAMITEGNGSVLFIASQAGELQTFTQNVCLVFLGIAMDEEIV